MELKLRNGVSVAETDYGLMLLDEDSGQYWNLNPTGASVLRTLLDGGTPAEAAAELTEQFSVDRQNANTDVKMLVGDLRSAGLLVDLIE